MTSAAPGSFPRQALTARIHLDRLRGNARLVRDRVPGHVRLMGVVKNDGYGHGAVRIARVLLECGTSELVTAGMAEGIALRRASISCPILVLSDPLHPRLEDALEHDLTVTVADLAFAARLARLAIPAGRTMNVHLKVDTGLGRFGVHPDQTLDAVRILSRVPRLRIQGVYSHLACTFHADAASDAFTREQLAVFERVLERMDRAGCLPPCVHMGSSTGLLGFPDRLCSGYFTAIRVGTLFYGFTERVHDWTDAPAPIAEVSTRVLQVRDVPAGVGVGYHRSCIMPRAGRLAVIQGGFSHGLHGDFSGVLQPLIHGRRTLMIGKPALGQSLLDVSDVLDVRPGSEALLAGRDLNMHQVGQGIGRGTWELLLPLLRNAEKIYVQA